MGLPYIDEIPKSRTYLQEFRGYNHTNNLGDNEFYDCLNLTNDNYPLLSTRKRRDISTTNDFCVDCIDAGGYTVCLLNRSIRNEDTFKYEDKLIFCCRQGPEKYEEDLGYYDSNTKYHIVRMGSNFIVFPLCFAYNTATNDGKFFDTTAKLTSGILIHCLSDGTEIDVKNSESSADNGDYYYKPGDDKPYTVYYKDSEGNESIVDDVYVKVKGGRFYGTTLTISKNTLDLAGVTLRVIDLTDVISGEDWFAFKGRLNMSRVEFSNRKVTKYLKGNQLYGEYTSEVDKYFFEYCCACPPFDYVIECRNRLWACRYDGKINEIYATALGSYSDWFSYGSDAGAAYAVSVGTPGEFTGAMTIDENPVFFKEDYIHKIYISSSGAHQLYTLNCRGVQKGSSKSIARVNEKIIYKSPHDFVLFDGTNVTSISECLGGNTVYMDVVAAGYRDKYYASYYNGNEIGILVYDIKRGIWQREDIVGRVIAMTSDVSLRIYTDFQVYTPEQIVGDEKKIPYMFETGIQGLTTPDGKYLVRIDYRVSLGFGDTFNVFIQYDSDGKWHNVARLTGDQPIPKVRSLPIMPRRCDHFKIKVTGRGDMKLYSITKTYERGAEYGY